jgi:hypothetical protein
MKPARLPQPVREALLSDTFWRLLPTPATYFLNRERLQTPAAMPPLPTEDWSRRERRELLAASEERLRNLEGKGPGLATVNAVIAAAVLVAITTGWDKSTALARIILGLASLYAALSLIMPLYLVGPLKRDTIHLVELTHAAGTADAEEALAQSAAEAAMGNDVRNLRVSNLLDAARRELSYALVLLVLWVLLVPATGLLKRDTASHPTTSHPVPAASRAGTRPPTSCVRHRNRHVRPYPRRPVVAQAPRHLRGC